MLRGLGVCLHSSAAVIKQVRVFVCVCVCGTWSAVDTGLAACAGCPVQLALCLLRWCAHPLPQRPTRLPDPPPALPPRAGASHAAGGQQQPRRPGSAGGRGQRAG